MMSGLKYFQILLRYDERQVCHNAVPPAYQITTQSAWLGGVSHLGTCKGSVGFLFYHHLLLTKSLAIGGREDEDEGPPEN